MPLKADEHPGESMGCCYIDIFECDFVSVFVRERTAETVNLNTTKEDTQNPLFCSCFVIWFGQCPLCYCYVPPLCIGPFLLCQFQIWPMCLCLWSVCVRVLFLCVPATNLCLFSVEPVNVQGFLSIFLSASTV